MSRRRSITLVLVGALLAGLVALVVGIPAALTHRREFPGERFYASISVNIVSWLLAGNAQNPVASDARAVAAGRAAYTGSCAVCHGAKGDGRGVFGQGTYPDATDLTKTLPGRSDAQVFWVVKNGLGFTAMPAFATQYKDGDIWSIVAFLRTLQQKEASAIDIPSALPDELSIADGHGDRAARGAAIYFALGCHLCHGAEGDAPGSLSILGRIKMAVVRAGDERGMPAYGPERITDAELADLEAFLIRFAAVP